MARENDILRAELHRKQEARGQLANEREPEPRGDPGSQMNQTLREGMAASRRETLRRVLGKAGKTDELRMMDAEEEAREARRLADEAARRAQR